MSRLLAWLPLAALAALALLFAGFGLHHDPHVNPAALVGKPLPALVLPALNTGAATPLRGALKGPTLVNVFASWCAPCAEESSTLLALHRDGVPLFGVAYEDDPAQTRGFLARYGDPFTLVVTDRDGRAGIDLGISGVPETFLVGADGMILAKHTGPLTLSDARGLLERGR